MKVNFKSPRYVLPLILLPFFLLLFYTYKSSFGKPKPAVKGKETLQDNVAEVSDQVKKSTLTDKLDAYRNQYKKADGYTAINQLQDDTTTSSSAPNLYNDREKRKLDSLRKAVAAKYKNNKSRSVAANHSDFPDASAGDIKPDKHSQSDRALAEALNRMRSQSPQNDNRNHQQNPDPMQLFRQQMALIDSMEKSHDPEYKAQQKKDLVAKQAAVLQQEKNLPVSKASNFTSSFNTVMPEQHDGLIRAIVDQDITGYAGSRLRIRLLEDMMAGQFLIKQGTYLYAEITGFSGQRVSLTINSVMQDDQLLPIKLFIYDNDGLPGLYVPASAFRDFTKDLGSGAGQGVTLQQSAENNNQMVMSIVQRMFESTSTAVSKLIRQNKAKLKYNTLVFLIDPETLRKHQ